MVAGLAIGQRTKRVDAPQKLTGVERFTGDLRLPGLLYARPVGSAYAHARIRGVDKSAALAIPGVVAVLTSDDLPIARDASGNPVKVPIAFGEALFAGHIIALVLADNDAAAQDGANAVEVDYEPLPVVNTLDRVMTDVQVAHRGLVTELASDDGRRARVIGDPIVFKEAGRPNPRFPPAYGEDSAAAAASLRLQTSGSTFQVIDITTPATPFVVVSQAVGNTSLVNLTASADNVQFTIDSSALTTTVPIIVLGGSLTVDDSANSSLVSYVLSASGTTGTFSRSGGSSA